MAKTKILLLSDQFRWSLLSPGDKVVVAVSGGPDSLSLLHLLWTQREARHLDRVEAAHLDHQLRGAESAAEAEWVAAWCAERGIVCHVGQADVAALAQDSRQSRQHAAREARYAFLLNTAEQTGATKIATGHTQDDQVETVLANILRGTGTDGLRGITERRGLIVRPLLDVSRLDIEAYCAANGLMPRQDPSNFSPDHYTRNRIRLELLPTLRRDYNARVEEAILRLSAIAGRDSDYLAMQTSAALADALQSESKSRLEMDRATLAALHPALLRYVLRQAIEKVRGSSEGISHEHLELVTQAIVSQSSRGFALMLSYPTCTVDVTEQSVVLRMAADGDEPLGNFSTPLLVPGESALHEIGWVVTASWEDSPGAIRVDADALESDSLVVRNWRRGDRSGDKIDPLGMGGRHKKVSDIFTDAKVTRSERYRIPIVSDKEGIIWIVGHTQSERAKVTPHTTRVLYLSAREVTSRPASV